MPGAIVVQIPTKPHFCVKDYLGQCAYSASEPHLYSKDDLFHGSSNKMPLLHCLQTS